MNLQDELGFLLNVAQDLDSDTEFIENHLEEAKFSASKNNYSTARDHISKIMTGGEGFNPNTPVAKFSSHNVDRVEKVYDELVKRSSDQ